MTDLLSLPKIPELTILSQRQLRQYWEQGIISDQNFIAEMRRRHNEQLKLKIARRQAATTHPVFWRRWWQKIKQWLRSIFKGV